MLPVDWVANLILLHIAAGTGGVAHAGAESFTPKLLMNILIRSMMIGIRRSFVLWGIEVLSSVFGWGFIRL